MTTTADYTKQIICPEHGEHNATLFMNGHQYAGIWECHEEAMSDSCEHKETHTEQVESRPAGPEDNTYNTNVQVCDACGVTVDG